jgi:hypothetical protein
MFERYYIKNEEDLRDAAAVEMKWGVTGQVERKR